MRSSKPLLLLGIIGLCCLQTSFAQYDLSFWIDSVNKPSGADDAGGPGSCLWEEPPEDGFSLTPCSTGICTEKTGTYKRNGTTRMTWCKKHYSLAAGSDRDTCIDGSWSSSGHKCIPCGRSKNNVDPQDELLLIHYGRNSSLGYFPWMAAIYMSLDEGLFEQTCGGTLISPRIVLSAAHCFTLAELDVTPEMLMVGLGKLYSNFYNAESSAVLSKVNEIVKPDRYVGVDHLYDLDIALLVLAQSVTTNNFVMPACVDWSGALAPEQDEIGYLAGWGVTETGRPSAVLKWAFQKYLNFKTCTSLIPPRDKKYLTHDKFCVEEIKGGKADKGDSGGGLTFVREEVHYVYGVVSTKLTGDVKNIRLFTNLRNEEHRAWLQRVWRRLHQQKSQTPQVAVSARCSSNSDCDDDKSCSSGKCVDLCPQGCGQNTVCRMARHFPVCSCMSGYTGDPHQSCIKPDVRPDPSGPVIVNPAPKDLEQITGDVCKQVGEDLWTCRYQAYCWKAVEDLKDGKPLQTCNAKDLDAVVCCEPEEKVPARESLSKKKCKEFASKSGGDSKKNACTLPSDLPAPGVFSTFRPGEFPYLAIIGDVNFKNYHYGILISEQYVLSSGFCSKNETCTKKVRFGVHDSSSGSGKGWPEYDIIEKHIHPRFDENNVYNSVGLYKLKTPVRFSKYVRPACLVPEHQYPGTKGIVVGELDTTFKKGSATIMPRKNCNITNVIVKDESMFCTDMYRGTNTMKMYSGVPMVMRLNDPNCMYGVLGMATYGSDGDPEGYMRVSHYIPWIENIVWPQ